MLRDRLAARVVAVEGVLPEHGVVRSVREVDGVEALAYGSQELHSSENERFPLRAQLFSTNICSFFLLREL